jgi:hypothetical protein
MASSTTGVTLGRDFFRPLRGWEGVSRGASPTAYAMGYDLTPASRAFSISSLYVNAYGGRPPVGQPRWGGEWREVCDPQVKTCGYSRMAPTGARPKRLELALRGNHSGAHAPPLRFVANPRGLRRVTTPGAGVVSRNWVNNVAPPFKAASFGLNRLRKNSWVLFLSAPCLGPVISGPTIQTTPSLGAPPLLI